MTASGRMLSLDVMRGLTLAVMIVVNMSLGDQSYAQLNHAAWNGLTLTDLVFPTFLFVVGSAMAVALPRLAAAGDAALVRKVAKRTVLIFLCGYLLYWFPFFKLDAAGNFIPFPLNETRFLGVLQRIALAYGAGALLVHFGGRRAALWFCVVALPLYAGLLLAFGDLTLPGNAVLRLDLALFGPAHLYHGEGVPFDPEGLLSTLPSIVNVLAGWLAVDWLTRCGRNARSVATLGLVGLALVLAGCVWGQWLPLNKKLWTSSYALVAMGVDCCVLALLTQWFDVLGRRGGTYFLEVLGRNTLFIYLLSEIGNSVLWLTKVGGDSLMMWLYHSLFEPLAGVRPGALLYALAYLACCWVAGWLLDRRGIYIRL